jgi:hypothetical protein
VLKQTLKLLLWRNQFLFSICEIKVQYSAIIFLSNHFLPFYLYNGSLSFPETKYLSLRLQPSLFTEASDFKGFRCVSTEHAVGYRQQMDALRLEIVLLFLPHQFLQTFGRQAVVESNQRSSIWFGCPCQYFRTNH